MRGLITRNDKQLQITLFTSIDSSSAATGMTSDQHVGEPEAAVANSSAVRAVPPVMEPCISKFSFFVSRDNVTKAEIL